VQALSTVEREAVRQGEVGNQPFLDARLHGHDILTDYHILNTPIGFYYLNYV
jgi:hypothetical protein